MSSLLPIEVERDDYPDDADAYDAGKASLASLNWLAQALADAQREDHLPAAGNATSGGSDA